MKVGKAGSESLLIFAETLCERWEKKPLAGFGVFFSSIERCGKAGGGLIGGRLIGGGLICCAMSRVKDKRNRSFVLRAEENESVDEDDTERVGLSARLGQPLHLRTHLRGIP